jgi:hypothetical protein
MRNCYVQRAQDSSTHNLGSTQRAKRGASHLLSTLMLISSSMHCHMGSRDELKMMPVHNLTSKPELSEYYRYRFTTGGGGGGGGGNSKCTTVSNSFITERFCCCVTSNRATIIVNHATVWCCSTRCGRHVAEHSLCVCCSPLARDILLGSSHCRILRGAPAAQCRCRGTAPHA